MPHKGYKQTAEHRRKGADAHRGKTYKGTRGWIHRSIGARVVMHRGREMLEHRVVMELHLRRELLSSEVVHHINKDRLDNRIENLQLMTKSQHSTFHDTGKSRKGQPHAGWTAEQRKRYVTAFAKRPPISAEARKRAGETMKKKRAKKF